MKVLLVCTAIASWISIVFMIDHRPPGATDFDMLYDKPWIRISPYLIGLAAGVLIVKLDKVPLVKTLRNCICALLGWLTAAALALSVVYGVYHANLTGPGLATPLGIAEMTGFCQCSRTPILSSTGRCRKVTPAGPQPETIKSVRCEFVGT